MEGFDSDGAGEFELFGITVPVPSYFEEELVLSELFEEVDDGFFEEEFSFFESSD